MAMVARAGLPRRDRRHRVLRHLGFSGDPQLVQLPSTGRYLWRRFIRIFPGFWARLLVTALLLAPLAWHHERGGWSGYFHVTHETPTGYVLHNSLLHMHQWNIAGLLGGTPFAHSGYPIGWDGSLWTLIYEFKCYLLIALLGVVGILTRHRAVVARLARGRLRFHALVAGRPGLGRSASFRPSVIRSSPASPSSSCSGVRARCTPSGSRSTTGWASWPPPSC